MKDNKTKKVQEALSFRKWIAEVDLNTAELTERERGIHEAIRKSLFIKRWSHEPIGEFAEPLNLDDLVGGNVNGANTELIEQSERLDNLYDLLSLTNNNIKADLENIDRLVTNATDDVKEVSILIADEDSVQYKWITDSFNNLTKVDLAQSDALIDTDYGWVTLPPTSFNNISGFKVTLEAETFKNQLPGCNILVEDGSYTLGSESTEPRVVVNNQDHTSISYMFDGDMISYFEVEKNILPPKQRLVKRGQALVTDPSGAEKDIKTETKNLDWKVSVQWPNQAKGVETELANFVFYDTTNLVKVPGSPTPGTQFDGTARLNFKINFNTPQTISYLQLAPFLRTGQNVYVDEITAVIDNVSIPIIRNQVLGAENKSSSNLQLNVIQNVKKRTGLQTVGAMYPIPTDRPINQLIVKLSSTPLAVKLAHPFSTYHTKQETRRRYGILGVSTVSVNRTEFWTRAAVFDKVPELTVTEESNSLTGTLSETVEGVPLGVTTTKGGGKIDTSGLISAAQLAKTGVLGKAAFKFLAVNPSIVPIAFIAGTAKLGEAETKKEITKTLQGYDIFDGYRSSVAIRNLSLLRVAFNSSFVLQTTKLTFSSPVNRIGLIVDEDVPESWGDGEWIEYYLSTDGVDWKKVQTLSSVTLEQSLVLDTPTSDIFLRVVGKGNSDDIYHTPKLQHWALRGLLV